MKCYFNGVIKLHEKNEFEGADGNLVSYIAYTIQTQNGEVISINSKKDFTDKTDEQSQFCIDVRNDKRKGGFAVSIVDIRPGYVETGEDEVT